MGGYRYQNRPGWPFDPATHGEPGVIKPPKGNAAARASQRKQRLEEFAAARAEGLSVTAAGERVGVARKTAARYEVLLEQQRGTQ